MAASADPRFTALDPPSARILPSLPDLPRHRRQNGPVRGRIVLMRALERGEIDAGDPAHPAHRCLPRLPGMQTGLSDRAWDTGRDSKAAREILAKDAGIAPSARAILAVFSHRFLWPR